MSATQAGVGNVIKNKPLTEMAMAFARGRALCAAARLGVGDALCEKELSLDELAAVCKAHAPSLRRLLRALASFGVVVEKSPDCFALTPLGQPLRKDAPNSEWYPIVFWSDHIADGWSQLTDCVRSGDSSMKVMERKKLTPLWMSDPDSRAIFTAVMGTAPAEDYAQIVRAWDFSKCHTAADLGGGGGALIDAALELFPNLQGQLVDNTEAIERAKPRFEKYGSRCKLIVADLCESVPQGADVHMLKHVLHGREDDAATKILRNCLAALPAHGRILIIEFVLPDVVDHVDALWEQRLMSDLNMMALTGGMERSAAQWTKLLNAAGLECQRIIPVPGDLVSIIEAAAM
jgi:O-methyltransferase domain/Dimerisation domain